MVSTGLDDHMNAFWNSALKTISLFSKSLLTILVFAVLVVSTGKRGLEGNAEGSELGICTLRFEFSHFTDNEHLEALISTFSKFEYFMSFVSL